MSTYNLLECSDNYSMTSRSIWNFYRNKLNDSATENNPASNKINNNKIITSNLLNTRQK